MQDGISMIRFAHISAECLHHMAALKIGENVRELGLLFLSSPVFEADDGLLISLSATLPLDFCIASGLTLVKFRLTWIPGGQFSLSQAGLQNSLAAGTHTFITTYS